MAYFLGNISAKNYQNPFMCVVVIVFNISVVFLDTVYITGPQWLCYGFVD